MKLRMPLKNRYCQWGFFVLVWGGVLVPGNFTPAEEPGVQSLERVKLSADGQHLVLAQSGSLFVPWGFNYDHDSKGLLL